MCLISYKLRLEKEALLTVPLVLYIFNNDNWYYTYISNIIYKKHMNVCYSFSTTNYFL